MLIRWFIFIFTAVSLGMASPAGSQDLPHSLLWKATKEGRVTIYLFGTIHLMPREDFSLDEKVKSAFAVSDILVLELDISDPNLQMEMMQLAVMNNGVTLNDLLSDQEFQILDNRLQAEAGIAVSMVNRFKPIIVGSFLMTDYLGSQPASYELIFDSLATALEMPIIGLESIAEQMAVFDSIPYADQAEDLMEMIEEKEETGQTFDRMIALYKAENLSELHHVLQEYMSNERESEFLLDRRNALWVNRIENLPEDKKAFIAVGAGHLAGPQGLIALLRQYGYTMTPIMDGGEKH